MRSSKCTFARTALNDLIIENGTTVPASDALVLAEDVTKPIQDAFSDHRTQFEVSHIAFFFPPTRHKINKRSHTQSLVRDGLQYMLLIHDWPDLAGEPS